LPCSFQLGRKDRLWKNLLHMQMRCGKENFNYMPQTFCLPADLDALKKVWDEEGASQRWILKPVNCSAPRIKFVANEQRWYRFLEFRPYASTPKSSPYGQSLLASARGIGVRLITKWAQVPKKRPAIVQKYLARPFLINESKFDLRIYVYISSINPLRVYIHEDGLVRFASQK
uniref:Tubulin--tyrosine ligase-like protein 9 n=1 Tax=Echinostoma caproni TaxID=27848 RepID=A0A183AWM1_9TREM